MSPEQYEQYAAVFDLFSDPAYHPSLQDFIKIIATYLRRQDRVTDVGCGTGLYDEMLIDLMPKLRLTVIEPSAHMLPLAKKRLGRAVCYKACLFEQALTSLPPQNAFIFQRSLYAIYNNDAHCKKLLVDVNRKLLDGGYIFLYDFKDKFGKLDKEAEIERFVYAKKDWQLNEYLSFVLKLKVLEQAREAFDDGLSNGEFYVFENEEALDALFKFAGFTKVLYVDHGNAFYAIYKKTQNRSLPLWWYKLLNYTH